MNLPTTDILIRTHSHRTTKLKWHTIDANFPSPRVPNELLDRIVELALPGPNLCSVFTPIAAFALASASFRQIALRRYFHDVTVHSKSQWIGLLKLIHAQEEKRVGRLGGGGFKWLRFVPVLCYKEVELMVHICAYI
jgi:hypothetical protein